VKFARWKAAAEFLVSKEGLKKIEEMELELEQLMEGLGAQLRASNMKGTAKQQSTYDAFTQNPPR
jgi:hypothetical protein